MNFLITALAVYGLSELLTTYDGAFSVLKRLRDKYPESALSCLICVSCWIVVPMMLLAIYGGIIFITPFAIIGVIMIVDRL